MRKILAVVGLILLFLSVHAFAEGKEIIAKGSYNMAAGETESIAESRALFEAKRIAIEQAWNYVMSYAKYRNLKLTDDEAKATALAMMNISVLDKKKKGAKGGFLFGVKIKASINLSDTVSMVKEVKDYSFEKDYINLLEAYEKRRHSIDGVKKQALQAKDEAEKKKAAAMIAKEERLFQAVEWVEKGYKHLISKAYDNAITVYTEAIVLDPDYIYAYHGRAFAYSFISQYDRAIEDYNKLLALDANDAIAYSNRGFAYQAKAEYDRAMEDYTKAIVLKPDYMEAYKERGAIYLGKKQYTQAVEDFSRVITLSPDLIDGYIGRGDAYFQSGLYDRAIDDYTKLMALLDKESAYYHSIRGYAYYKNGQYDEAISDFDKVISLTPDHIMAIVNRGNAYFKKGRIDKTIADFQKLCDRGLNEFCKAVQRLSQDK